jgi:hypothetical protein
MTLYLFSCISKFKGSGCPENFSSCYVIFLLTGKSDAQTGILKPNKVELPHEVTDIPD